MFKKIRIGILSLVLLIVAMQTWRSQAQAVAWEHPLHAVVFPINGDGSDASARHIAALTEAHFRDVDEFFATEAQRYRVRLNDDQLPLRIALAPEVNVLPPTPPENGNVFGVALWSLRLRYWAWKYGETDGMPAQIRVFVIYHDPATRLRLAHSIGLQKGLIGVVNAFAAAEMDGQNHVVIAHEILHTLGASDKYDSANNLPAYPEGYADPAQQPRYPQTAAEIMGGRIPLSETVAEIPKTLRLTVVGEQTAREIGWRE
jgi:hypothetical protein